METVSWLFVRVLALIYFAAFASLGVQITGLVGAHGILPAGEFFQAVRRQAGRRSAWLAPTLFWLNASDAALKAACIAGALLSLLLVAVPGPAQPLILAALYLLYLSLAYAGQTFLGYQWDVLLLETGFLAIFLGIAPIVPWLFRWLLFRLMFLSGLAKLVSHDPTWRDLTALKYHYETQPLPTVLGWLAHKLPLRAHQFSAAAMFFIELILPFLVFGPQPLPWIAGAGTLLLQLLILLTGNYTFFNLLSIALCLFVVDDAALRAYLPAALGGLIPAAGVTPAGQGIAIALAALIVFVSVWQLYMIFGGAPPAPVAWLLGALSPLRIVNTYGLFANMTTVRPEIVVEGSRDGETWRAYEFRYKPGDVKRAPRWAAPHQPRLDWQMWFAALRPYQANPWFVRFVLCLLQGSPEVIALLKSNPFPDAPPQYVRAMLYDYRFTDIATLRREGAWWRRELLGAYLPPVSLAATEAS